MARKKTIDELRIEREKAEQDLSRADPQCANPPSLHSRSYA